MLDRTFAMNLKKINLELARQALLSDNTASDKITLWHVAKSNLGNDSHNNSFFVKKDSFNPNKVFDNLQQFLDNGALSIGKGFGGQQGGFFVYNKKPFAVSYFYNHLAQTATLDTYTGFPTEIQNHAGEALLIGTITDKNKLVYPNWQFDLESAVELNQLLYKYRDLVYNTTLKHKNGMEIVTFTEKEGATPEMFTIRKVTKAFGLSVKKSITVGYDGIDNIEIFQELFDKLCENKDFRQNYNELLQKSTTSNTRTAIKYCGKSPLNVDEISYLKKDTDGNMTETLLYTSSTCKEKQICPFLQLKFAKEKD